MTLIATLCFAIIVNGLGVESSENQTLQNIESIGLINAAQHMFCKISAKCHISENIEEDMTKLQSIIDAQEQVDFRQQYACELCKCSEECCCDDEDEPDTREEDFDETIKCVYPQAKQLTQFDNTFPQHYFSYQMIMSCPSLNHNDTGHNHTILTAEKCANAIFDDGFLMVPIYDVKTKKLYRNKYCLECNSRERINTDNLIYWKIRIECSNTNFPVFKTIHEVLESKMCNVLFDPPGENTDVVRCHKLVDRCNITGEWVVYDPDIVNLCGLYTAPFYFNYKNFFCYLCNEAPYRTIIRNDTGYLRDLLLPISGAITHTDGDDCPWNLAFDTIQGRCVKGLCVFPRIFIKGQCTDAGLLPYDGIIFRLFMVLVPIYKVEYINYSAKGIGDFIRYWLKKINLHDTLTTLSIHYLAGMNVNESETIIEYFVVHMEFYLAQKNQIPFRIDGSVYDKLLLINEFDCSACDFANNMIVSNHFFYYDHFDISYSIRHDDIKLYIVEKGSIRNLTAVYEDISPTKISPRSRNSITTLYPTYTCPLILLHGAFYKIRRFNWGIYIGRIGTALNKSEYFIHEADGTCSGTKCVFVCFDTFQKIKEKYDSLFGSCAFLYKLNTTNLIILVAAVRVFFSI